MADLRVLAITDSFSAEWPALAQANGLSLVSGDDAGSLEPGAGSITLVAAGGDERMLEVALRQLPAGNRLVAAVGASTDHRLVAAIIRAGADEYFALPQDLASLRSWVEAGAARLQAERAAAAFAAEERGTVQFEGIMGTSDALRAALDRAVRVIQRPNVTVLLTGETGTGKELLARAIHYNGPRRAGPFVDVNCAAIPETLLESELFGHEKGAFTGATAAKPGLMQLADGGTLFLDEIGHLPLPLQGKLLRALEERSIRRLGGSRSIPFDVRLVAATHVNLLEAVRRGEFREDLYYRLNVMPIELPALRDRADDILLLADHFLVRFKREYDVPALALAPAASRALRERPWPGNVRELRNTMERAVLLADGAVLDAEAFAVESARGRATTSAGDLPFPATIAELTQAAARRMLALCDGNKSVAARRLGISRPRLHRLLDASLDQLESDDGDVNRA
ncbi:MAG: sigma 54-interacting transcriptional regulator [bacterium]